MSFKYFAYGSNLLKYRLSLSCPSVTKHCIGKICGYELKFGKYAERWKGGVASIQVSGNADDEVWGVVWEINSTYQKALDNQEGVFQGHYKPLLVDVKTESGHGIECRTYQLSDLGGDQGFCSPSPQYHGIILEGASENGLPQSYIDLLKTIETNGNTEVTDLMKSVEETKKMQKTGV